jgi:protein SCO1/2
MTAFFKIFSALALAVLATIPVPASAHSTKDKGELDRLMGDKEKYFQSLDRKAPEFTLQDADGNAVRLTDLRGKVVVLHFIYAGCPDVCPLHADKIANVQMMVNQTPMKDVVHFVTVTTDPANDTAGVMRDYGPAHGLDRANWSFLTTTPDQPEDGTRRLARSYGHKFDKTGDGYQVHGVVTHVIDRDGRWRGNFHGLRFNPTNLVLFINALTNDAYTPHGHGETSWWERFKGMF